MVLKEEIIKLKHVSKFFRRNSIKALDDVSISLYSGEIVGIVGGNGSGKSTLLKAISGLITPDSGIIERKFDIRVPCMMAVVLEGEQGLYKRLTSGEMMIHTAVLHGAKVDKALRRRSNMLLSDFKINSKAFVGELSKGMKQKLVLSSALLLKPKVILLDEPTLGLDAESTNTLISHIKSLADDESSLVLLATHDVSFINELPLRKYDMCSGRIIGQ